MNLKVENNTFVCTNIIRMKSEKSEIQLHIISKLKDLRETNNLSLCDSCNKSLGRFYTILNYLKRLLNDNH